MAKWLIQSLTILEEEKIYIKNGIIITDRLIFNIQYYLCIVGTDTPLAWINFDETAWQFLSNLWH